MDPNFNPTVAMKELVKIFNENTKAITNALTRMTSAFTALTTLMSGMGTVAYAKEDKPPMPPEDLPAMERPVNPPDMSNSQDKIRGGIDNQSEEKQESDTQFGDFQPSEYPKVELSKEAIDNAENYFGYINERGSNSFSFSESGKVMLSWQSSKKEITGQKRETRYFPNMDAVEVWKNEQNERYKRHNQKTRVDYRYIDDTHYEITITDYHYPMVNVTLNSPSELDTFLKTSCPYYDVKQIEYDGPENGRNEVLLKNGILIVMWNNNNKAYTAYKSKQKSPNMGEQPQNNMNSGQPQPEIQPNGGNIPPMGPNGQMPQGGPQDNNIPSPNEMFNGMVAPNPTERDIQAEIAALQAQKKELQGPVPTARHM